MSTHHCKNVSLIAAAAQGGCDSRILHCYWTAACHTARLCRACGRSYDHDPSPMVYQAMLHLLGTFFLLSLISFATAVRAAGIRLRGLAFSFAARQPHGHYADLAILFACLPNSGVQATMQSTEPKGPDSCLLRRERCTSKFLGLLSHHDMAVASRLTGDSFRNTREVRARSVEFPEGNLVTEPERCRSRRAVSHVDRAMPTSSRRDRIPMPYARCAKSEYKPASHSSPHQLRKQTALRSQWACGTAEASHPALPSSLHAKDLAESYKQA